MLNQYLEPIIIRKVLAIEKIYTNPNITIHELAKQLGIHYYLIQRLISELKKDPLLALTDCNGHLTIDNLANIEQYEAFLYQQSAFLNYLKFVLTNQNPHISVVNLSFILNRSTSSLYETRKQIIQALEAFGLTLHKNIVTGNELTKRLLIATLNHKYKLTDLDQEDLALDDGLLDQLIHKHLNLSVTEAYQLQFYRQLIVVGWQRHRFQNDLPKLDAVAKFDNTKLATNVHAFVDELTQLSHLNHPMTKASYHYFLYVTLITAPINISDSLYQVITTINPYQELADLFSKPSPLKEQLLKESRQELIISLFRQTFLHRDQFIPFSQLTMLQVNETALHPQVQLWGQTILKRTFNYDLNSYFIKEFSLNMQNLMYTQFDFKLGIFTINLSPSLIDGLRNHLKRSYNGQFEIIPSLITTDFQQQLQKFDGIMVLTSSLAYAQLNQQLAKFSPKLTCLAVTSRSLLDLSPILFNTAIKLKITNFNEWLDSYRN